MAKFNRADQNNDGELNIDEYLSLKENKEQIADKPKTVIKSESDKAKSLEEAHEILKPILLYTSKNYFRWDHDEFQKDRTNAVNAFKKINSSNIVEIITSFGTKTILVFINAEYAKNLELKKTKIKSLYSFLEARAAESNCLQRYKQAEKNSIKNFPENHRVILGNLADVISMNEEQQIK